MTIDSSWFLKLVSANVNNSELTDAEFRALLRPYCLTTGTKYESPIGNYGELILREEFINWVRMGILCDDDGTGYLSDGRSYSKDQRVYPSEVATIPSEVTHILWFGK